MGIKRPAWEKIVLLCGSLAFTFTLVFNLPKNTLSLGVFVMPIILAAVYYGLAGGMAGACISAALAAIIARSYSIPLYDTEIIAQCILYFLIGGFAGSMQREQDRIQEALHHSAITDELTGLYNYQHFRVRLDEEVKRAKRYGHPVSLMMCDVNRMKKINDSLGHASGNFVLNKIAGLIKDSVRSSDISFRYGGDEFTIILPETGEEAEMVAGRIIAAVNSAFSSRGESEVFCPSLSVGIAVRTPDVPVSVAALISTADHAMYRAKSEGKSMVMARIGA